MTALRRLLARWTILVPRRWPAGSHHIILTFDDGPSPVSDALLDVLKKHAVPAVFCYIGANMRKRPQMVRRTVAEGHTIALHSDSHTTKSLLWRDRLSAELERTRALVPARVTHFRPPLGVKTPAVRQYMHASPYAYAYLTFFVNDAGATSKEQARIMQTIQKRILHHNGGAIVLHEMRYKAGGESSVDKSWLPDAVEALIVWGRAQGFTFTSYRD